MRRSPRYITDAENVPQKYGWWIRKRSKFAYKAAEALPLSVPNTVTVYSSQTEGTICERNDLTTPMSAHALAKHRKTLTMETVIPVTTTSTLESTT